MRTFKGREASQRWVSEFVGRELENRSASAECANRGEDGMSRSWLESFYFIMLDILRSVGGIACVWDADPLLPTVHPRSGGGDADTDGLLGWAETDGVHGLRGRFRNQCWKDARGGMEEPSDLVWDG